MLKCVLVYRFQYSTLLKRLYKILIFFLILFATGIVFGFLYVNKTFSHPEKVETTQGAKTVYVTELIQGSVG